jgi:hypothetical protein
VASVDPPSPRATRWKVVVSVGLTVLVPLVSTAPIPSMETSVALVVVQLSAALCPGVIVSGVTVMLAVGAGVV